MKKMQETRPEIDSIAELHRRLGLPGPAHPLVSIVKCADISNEAEADLCYRNSFYIVSLKKGFTGKLRYGQQYYDFDEGVMSFFAPGQIISGNPGGELTGWSLILHPDFIRNFPLGKTIGEYGYFSYAVNEALHLSEKEEGMIVALMQQVEQEYAAAIDVFSQKVIVAQIELLLSYCDRFYNRQFITRASGGNDLLTRVEAVLSGIFECDDLSMTGLPGVAYVAEQLHVSPTYLSDMLRSLTGQNTQQHIHAKLIAKAKELLATTSLSVGEVAYRLGFDYPQSFNKLFRNKTDLSPLQFRRTFN